MLQVKTLYFGKLTVGGVRKIKSDRRCHRPCYFSFIMF